MSSKKNSLVPGGGKKYIISLNKWRSALALAACLVTEIFALYAIAGGIVKYASNGESVSGLFRYFTTNANLITAVGAGFIFPFAVEGVRKKRFTYPKWLAMIHYCGTIYTTLTMVIAVGMISWFDRELAFGGYNIYLHIVCPLMVLISFMFVEAGVRFTVKDAAVGVIPFFIYEMIYLYKAVIIGADNGGWEDMYHVTEYIPVPLAFLFLTLACFVIALLIRLVYNRLTERRVKRIKEGLWQEDVEPVEIKVEMFGLGRYMGGHADKEHSDLPMELADTISERYDIDQTELLVPYIKGYLDSMKEKQ